MSYESFFRKHFREQRYNSCKTELVILSEVKHKYPAALRASLVSIRTARLYYVVYGRNAWQSTWITRYQKGCMHLSLQSAKLYVEIQRTQGSVFTIQELPAIRLIGDNEFDFFVTQINSENPFLDYGSVKTVLSDEQKMSRLGYAFQEGVEILKMMIHFGWQSPIWLEPPPRSDSILIFVGRTQKRVFASPSRTRGRKWVSKSIGPGKDLCWSEQKRAVSELGISQTVIMLRAAQRSNTGN